ncbi:DUF1330 domain-containing protein [Vibrio rhodolitus]|uniref:DUF1330 domain-containing protein n=1 Tax=Vibrio rhodolitus TaxID=2231649 RepID=UPI000E0BB80D|nr:DUF1330 domain-containing protein [Vibrio rhodolitus]
MSIYYSVLEVTPTKQDWVPAYVENSNRLVEKHGGKYIARTSVHESLEGDRENPALRIIIQWPSRQAALDFMQDPEYAPHLAGRSAGSISHHTLIEGVDALA